MIWKMKSTRITFTRSLNFFVAETFLCELKCELQDFLKIIWESPEGTRNIKTIK